MRIAILDDIHDAWDSTDGVRRMRERAEVVIFKGFPGAAALANFDALIANRERTKLTRELLHQLAHLRLIVQTGNHAPHIDFAAARELEIPIAQASGGYSIGAAEITLGLAQAVMRQITANDAAVRRGQWPQPLTPVLHGKTIGLVGLGRVARHVARIAAGYGMRVAAWSRTLDPARAASVGATLVDLDELLATADVVSIHVSLTPATRGLIDARRLALMKPTSYLINTARGPVVDEQALVAALTERRIAGAGLDVFEREPLPAGHAFLQLPNVVLTAHIGWTTDDGYRRFSDAAADALLAYLDGRPYPLFGEH
jgi:phosphoglycerate dehydrogenase-like enzyme